MSDTPVPPPAPEATPSTFDVPKDHKTWGMLCHLAALAGFVIPLGSFLGPLVVWLIKKNEMPFVDDQGKEALNFQITTLIAAIVSGLLCLVFIGFILLAAIGVAWLVLTIMAALKANEGVKYRYPLTLRLLK